VLPSQNTGQASVAVNEVTIIQIWLFKSKDDDYLKPANWPLPLTWWMWAQRQRLKTPFPVPVCSCGLSVWLSSPSDGSPPMDGAQRMWNSAGGLSLRLRSYSHVPSAKLGCGSNLVKNGCCHCETGCAFWLHGLLGARGLEAVETMRGEGGSFESVGGMSAYSWHLKDDSPQTSSSASLLPRPHSFPSSFYSSLTRPMRPNNNNKASAVNSGCDIYL